MARDFPQNTGDTYRSGVITGNTTTETLVHTGAGRLNRINILTAGTASFNIYDGTQSTGGTLIFTSLTNDAVGTIPRLIDLGLSPVSIAASFRGVVAQRLIRRACTHCREAIAAGDELNARETELAARYGVRPRVRAVGCKFCGSTGYRGRMALAEVLVATPTFLDAVARSAAPSVLQQLAVTGGMRPIREVAPQCMARPTSQRFDPILCTHDDGTVAGIARIERVFNWLGRQ